MQKTRASLRAPRKKKQFTQWPPKDTLEKKAEAGTVGSHGILQNQLGKQDKLDGMCSTQLRCKDNLYEKDVIAWWECD